MVRFPPVRPLVCVGAALTSLVIMAGAAERKPLAFDRVPASLPEPAPLELSLREAVLRAIQVNYDVSLQKLETQRREADVLRERGAFEPVLFGESGRETTGETVGQTNETLNSAKAGVRTKWGTGTELTLSSEYADERGTDGGSGRAVAELSQPLLKGAGIASSRADLVIARRNRDISLQDLKRQMIDTATSVSDAYLYLIAAKERLNVQQDSLAHARDLATLTDQRAAAGLMGESDTVEARAAVFAREADVAQAAEQVRALEDVLKESLSLLEEPASWTAPVVTTTEPVVPGADADFLPALDAALKNRADYEAELLRLKNADLSLWVAKVNLLPKLDLAARATAGSDAESFSEAFTTTRTDEDVWSVFLRLEIPLGNKDARGQKLNAKAEREQEVVRVKQLELRIVREVRQAADAVNTGRQVAEATAKAVEFEQRKLETERSKLELGRSTTDQVVRFIESLNAARLNHVQAVIGCHKALVRLYQAEGTTLEEYGVTLE